MAMASTMTPTAANGGIYPLRPGETGVAEVAFVGQNCLKC
jgi:hypothetical protein